MNTGPKVSICIIAYNHGKFIAEAIDSVLMQKTDFAFEIVIGDDASIDDTSKIIQEYQNNHPNIIKHIKREKNIGAMKNFTDTFNNCTGKYIALLEGDDYWTDPNKLQKQIDFLEANSDFSICFHRVQIIYEDHSKEPHLSNSSGQKEVTTIEDLANSNNYIYTASCVFRNGLIKYFPDWFYELAVGDYPLHLLNAQYGKIKFIPNVMCVYRVNEGGIWANRTGEYMMGRWIEMQNHLIGKFQEPINTIILRKQQENILNYYRHIKKSGNKSIFEINNLPKGFLTIPFRALEYREENEILKNEIYCLKQSYFYKIGIIIKSLLRCFKLLR